MFTYFCAPLLDKRQKRLMVTAHYVPTTSARVAAAVFVLYIKVISAPIYIQHNQCLCRCHLETSSLGRKLRDRDTHHKHSSKVVYLAISHRCTITLGVSTRSRERMAKDREHHRAEPLKNWRKKETPKKSYDTVETPSFSYM